MSLQPLADVVMHVEKGYRMESPDGCVPEIYEIMIAAWKIRPEERPSFSATAIMLNTLRTSTV